MSDIDKEKKLAHRNTRLKAKNRRYEKIINECIKLLQIDGDNTKAKVLDMLKYAINKNKEE